MISSSMYFYLDADTLFKSKEYELSRQWQPAPKIILPPAEPLCPSCQYARRISPAEWTGKNFKKVK